MKSIYQTTLGILILLFLFVGNVLAQEPSALVDFESNTQGVLVPRMLSTEREAISMPATGLLVYQTDGNTGFYFNYGTPGSPDWRLLGSGSGEPVWEESAEQINAGDINQSLLFGDTIMEYNGDMLEPGWLSNSKVFYNRDKSAFRAAGISTYLGNDTAAFDLDSLGYFSTGFGVGNMAKGFSSSVLGGWNNRADGDYSAVIGGVNNRASNFWCVAAGAGNHASAYNSTSIGGFLNVSEGSTSSTLGGSYLVAHDMAQVAIGRYNRISSGFPYDWWDYNQLFSIGNGYGEIGVDTFRHNALTVYANGILEINDAYRFPNADGLDNQVLTTDGAGNVNWETPIDNVDDADSDPTNEIETWSTLGGIPAGFADNIDNVNDADSDPTNEIETWSTLGGIPAGFADNIDNVIDADSDPTNEIELPVGGSDGQVLTTDGFNNVSWSDISLDTDLGIGTSSPFSEVHIHGLDELTELTLTPQNSISNDSSSIYLSEISTGAHGVRILYDGVSNSLQMQGKLNGGFVGDPFLFDRTEGDIGLGALSTGNKLNVEGDTRVSEFTQLGSDAPKIKMKKYTGTTPSMLGESVTVNLDMAPTKVLGVDVIIKYGVGGSESSFFPFNDFSGGEYRIYIDTSGDLIIKLDSTNSHSLLNKPFRVLITYEE